MHHCIDELSFLKVSYDMLIITSLIIPELIDEYLVNYSCGQCTDYSTETEVVDYFKIRKGHKFAASKQFTPLWNMNGTLLIEYFISQWTMTKYWT